MSVFIAESVSSCQVYPSEYAYHQNSVYRSERKSANCRKYHTPMDYIYCDGTQLRLTDSDIGSEQYTTSDYYVWHIDDTRYHQFLFIFPIRVNLTTITLHYYHTSVRGLPRLRFWAVPDDFDVWDALTSGYSPVDVAAVPPSEEPAGRRNISISFNTTTMKILLLKFSTNFSFALSEVEFFNISQCNSVKLKISSLTRNPTTASQYHFYVTEITSMISRTSSKLLIGSKIIITILYVTFVLFQFSTNFHFTDRTYTQTSVSVLHPSNIVKKYQPEVSEKNITHSVWIATEITSAMSRTLSKFLFDGQLD